MLIKFQSFSKSHYIRKLIVVVRYFTHLFNIILTGFQQAFDPKVLIVSGIEWNNLSYFGINSYFYATKKGEY